MISPKIAQMTRFAALALSISVALGAGGCVSMDDYKRLEAAHKQALDQLAQAENDLANMRKQLDALNAELAAKDALIQQGLGNDALLKERDLLAARLADLQKKYDELVAINGKVEIPKVVNDALRALADKYPNLLEWDERLGLLRLKSDLTFDLGSTEVKPGAKEALKAVAGILDMPEIAGNELRIMGHTDDVPIRARAGTMNPTNWYLSTNRAHAVREVLQGDGVSQLRMQAAGWGEYRPIAPNAPGMKGNEKNRRVEIYILPTKVPENVTGGMPGAEHPHSANGGVPRPGGL